MTALFWFVEGAEECRKAVFILAPIWLLGFVWANVALNAPAEVESKTTYDIHIIKTGASEQCLSFVDGEPFNIMSNFGKSVAPGNYQLQKTVYNDVKCGITFDFRPSYHLIETTENQ